MQTIINFFDQPFFIILGGIATLFSLMVLVVTIYLWARGIIPVWWRLGVGLSTRKIAIFAEDEFDDLKSVLVDSKIFKESNIIKITKQSIKKAEGLSLLLVHWKCFENEIDEILGIKKDSAALIVYAPHSEGQIAPEIVGEINRHRNSILVNLRGRLLNDILTSMMTTSFEKK